MLLPGEESPSIMSSFVKVAFRQSCISSGGTSMATTSAAEYVWEDLQFFLLPLTLSLI
jgi:hypothetical protein